MYIIIIIITNIIIKKKKKKVIRLESEECVDCFISAFQVVRSQHKLEWNAALHLMPAGGMEVLDPVHSYHFSSRKSFSRTYATSLISVLLASGLVEPPGHHAVTGVAGMNGAGCRQASDL